MTNKLFAFVLMPFDHGFDDRYRLGIKEAAEELGIIATRVDEQIFHKESILERIYTQINSADLIIADMTGRNPNVFYEVGYAHAKGKICILVTSEASDIPFDLKHHRHIVYGGSIVDLKRRLISDLQSVKSEIEVRERPIVVEIGKTNGDLSQTSYSATAKIDIYLDFHNRTDDISPNIDAIYFYTGNGWSYTQDGQECPQTSSDIKDYNIRHIIKSPIVRLNKGGWSQVKIIGSKDVWFKWDGTELKDSYRMTGRAMVRIVTSREIYDFVLNLNVEANDIPF